MVTGAGQDETTFYVPACGTPIGVRELGTLEMLGIVEEAAAQGDSMASVLVKTQSMQRERALTRYGQERVDDRRDDGSAINAIDLIAKMPARHYSLFGKAVDKLHEVPGEEVDAFLASANNPPKKGGTSQKQD